MSRTNDRIIREVQEGRLDEIGDFILEHIHYDGADDVDLVEELVRIYFERLENEG